MPVLDIERRSATRSALYYRPLLWLTRPYLAQLFRVHGGFALVRVKRPDPWGQMIWSKK